MTDPHNGASVLIHVRIHEIIDNLFSVQEEEHVRAVGPFPTADAARGYADEHPLKRGQGYWIRVPLEAP